MEYIRTTPHCGRYCWRLKNGQVRHYHSGKKRRFRKRDSCKDTCCAPNRARWRQRNAPRADDE